MYTMIIAFIVAIIVGIILIRSHIDEELKSTIVFFIMFIGVALGGFSPISGFTAPIQVQEIALIPFSSDETHLTNNTQNIFVQISDNTVFYKYAKENVIREDDNSAFNVVTESIKRNVKIRESSTCTIPVLKIYRKHGISSKWTFAWFCEEDEYIFYIPTNSKQYLN